GIRWRLALAAAFMGRHAVLAERRETVAVAAAVRVLTLLALGLVGLGRRVGLAGHLCLLAATRVAALNPGAGAGRVLDPGRIRDPAAAARRVAVPAPGARGWPDAD